MDMMAEINQYLSSPAFKQAREARRAARHAFFGISAQEDKFCPDCDKLEGENWRNCLRCSETSGRPQPTEYELWVERQADEVYSIAHGNALDTPKGNRADSNLMYPDQIWVEVAWEQLLAALERAGAEPQLQEPLAKSLFPIVTKKLGWDDPVAPPRRVPGRALAKKVVKPYLSVADTAVAQIRETAGADYEAFAIGSATLFIGDVLKESARSDPMPEGGPEDMDRVYDDVERVLKQIMYGPAKSAAAAPRLALALGRPSAVMAREARGGWNMPANGQDIIEGAAIGSQHPGAAALMVVRQALAEYHVPNSVDLRYTGMKRVSGHGPHAVDEGVIFVEATLHSLSGPRHHVDIPVIVKEGRLLSPSVLVYNGHTRVLAQSTFDDIIGGGEFKADAAERNNMYAPPPDRNANAGPKRRVPVINPGMFALAPARRLIHSAVEKPSSWERDAAEFIANAAVTAIHDGELAKAEDLEAYVRQATEADAEIARTDYPDMRPDYVQRVMELAMAQLERKLDPDALRRGQLEVLCETCGGGGVVEKSRPTREDPGYYDAPCPDCKGDPDDWGSEDDRYGVRQAQNNLFDAFDLFPEMESDESESVAAEHLQRGSRFKVDGHGPTWIVTVGLGSSGEVRREKQKKAWGYLHDRDADEIFIFPVDASSNRIGPDIAAGKVMRLSGDAAKQAFYEPDASELLENGSLGRDVPGAANSHLDMAERPLDDALMPGQTVTLKQNATVRDRGGVAYSIAKGTKGRVVRDVDGANWAYVVRFADLGYAATVPRRALA